MFFHICIVSVYDRRSITPSLSKLSISAVHTEKMEAFIENFIISKICSRSTDCNHGNPVHKKHNQCEDRETEPSVGNDLIDLIRSRHLPCLFLLIAGLDHFRDIDISLIGNDTLGIIIQFFFSSLDIALDVGELIFSDLQMFHDFVITLEDLNSIPSLLFFRHIVYDCFFDMGKCMLDRTGEAVLRDRLCIVCCIDGCLCCFHDTVALQRGDIYYFTAELTGELRKIDLIPVFLDDIHHVDRYNDRDTKLCQLCGQVEVSLEVRTIDDVQDRIRSLADQVVSRYNFLECVRRQGINTRKVRNNYIVVFLQFSFFFLNGYTRPVTDKLICAGQRVKKSCLTTVRVTC